MTDSKMPPLNIIDPKFKESIWNPQSEFQKELELYKLRAEIKPRKSRMMDAQVGMIKDMCPDPSKPKIFIPGGNKGGGFI
jgi:hypothetical protein